MKLKLFAVFAIAGMAIVGCGSNKSDEQNADSVTVDTTMNTTGTDTMTMDSATTDTSMTKPADSTKR